MLLIDIKFRGNWERKINVKNFNFKYLSFRNINKKIIDIIHFILFIYVYIRYIYYIL